MTRTRILNRSNESEIADYLTESNTDFDSYEFIPGLVRAILIASEMLMPSERELALEEAQMLLADGLDYASRG